MTYSEEDMQRPLSGGFTRAELETMPDSAVLEVMRGRLTKSDWDRAQAAAVTAAAEAEYSTRDHAVTSPALPTSQDPYAVTAWGQDEEDFTVPSGQKCRLRKLDEKILLEAGILDQVTRLPGLVTTGPIRQGEGKPPAPDMSDILKSPGQLKELLDVMNKLVCTVVVRPEVLMEAPEGGLKPGQVLVTSVGLGDRVAIMERVMGGVTKLDNFREGSA